MKCIVQSIPEVDTPVAVYSGWSGHSSLSDEQRVNISKVHGVHPNYLSTATFSALLFKDTGSYTCWAYVSPFGKDYGHVQKSRNISDIVEIHIRK